LVLFRASVLLWPVRRFATGCERIPDHQIVKSYAIVEAPSVLGTAAEFAGVRRAPAALVAAGLAGAIGARVAGRIEPPPPTGDEPQSRVPNTSAIREYAFRLADAVGDVIARAEFPIVLGGDCSILLGSLLACARRGRHGLAFIDGHMDFYPPEHNEWDGRAANSELAFAAGRGPLQLTDFGLGRALVRDDDVVAIGIRDHANQRKYGRSLPAMMLSFSRDDVRRLGAVNAASRAMARLTRTAGPAGYFIHLDADAVDGRLMPAVDDPSPDGFSWEETVALLGALARHDRAVGLQVTIYNPDVDPDGAAGRGLVDALAAALRAEPDAALAARSRVDAVTLEAATAETAPVLENLLDLYIHELSGIFSVDIGPDGRFRYERLPLYWSEAATRHAFLIRCSGRLAGFVLVTHGSPASDDPQDLDVAEFFVLRRFRRTAVGRRAAALLWNTLRGNWVVRVSEANHPAMAFWKHTIAFYSADVFSETAREGNWRVFRFQSRSPIPGP
jgi:arginase